MILEIVDKNVLEIMTLLNTVFLLIKKKLYGPFLCMGFNCLKARATSRRQFTTKFPEISGTHFVDRGRMKG